MSKQLPIIFQSDGAANSICPVNFTDELLQLETDNQFFVVRNTSKIDHFTDLLLETVEDKAVLFCHGDDKTLKFLSEDRDINSLWWKSNKPIQGIFAYACFSAPILMQYEWHDVFVDWIGCKKEIWISYAMKVKPFWRAFLRKLIADFANDKNGKELLVNMEIYCYESIGMLINEPEFVVFKALMLKNLAAFTCKEHEKKLLEYENE